jgi:hypothetical protein
MPISDELIDSNILGISSSILHEDLLQKRQIKQTEKNSSNRFVKMDIVSNILEHVSLEQGVDSR